VQRRLIALVLVAIVLVVYAPIALGGMTWDDEVYHTEVAPPRIAAADAVLHGELPTWWEGTALGVPLLAEPSHGAAYPIGWLAATPRALDLLAIVHVLWCALGIALLARRMRATDLGAVVAGALVATSGVLVDAALGGALLPLAHLPWLALACMSQRRRGMLRANVRTAIGAAVLLGLIGLGGNAILFIEAIVLACVLLARQWRRLVVVLAPALAIASIQWLPALLVRGDVVGASSHALAEPLVLVASLPLVMLAMLGKGRVLAVLVPLGVLAFVHDAAHAATLVVVAAPYAALGFDRVAAKVRPRLRIVVVAAVLAPMLIAVPVRFPLIDRSIVDEPPAWQRAAERSITWPRRVYRPVMTFAGKRDPADASLAARIETLAGTSAAKWGTGAARSEDPARPRVHDRVWSAASAAGGSLFDRYGIALAILPASMVGDSGGVASKDLIRSRNWALVEFPASPTAAVVNEWIFAPDVDTALARMFPPGAERGLSSGVLVLTGQGAQNQDEPGPAQPCKLLRWDAGAIDVECTTDRAAYAVVSSTAATGWSASIDGRDTPWLAADVMRRAVPLEPGTHRIAWRYAAPGLRLALALAALAIAALIALWLVYGRDSDARDQTPDPDRSDVN
jgi:hypothetical protein